MATITDPEATQILTQLTQVQAQLTDRAKTTSFTADLQDIRDDITTEQGVIASLLTRLNNGISTLLDLESRVRALENP